MAKCKNCGDRTDVICGLCKECRSPFDEERWIPLYQIDEVEDLEDLVVTASPVSYKDPAISLLKQKP